jgi:hypothetical protein
MLDAILTKSATEHEPPILTNCRIDKADPELAQSKKLILTPKRDLMRTDRLDPIVKQSRTLALWPHRAKLRSDIEDPMKTSPNTDNPPATIDFS